ncbi:MAG: hypothetical protein HDT40_08440 [Lachnospiraceae bacterium]|nr:hypothetical protein [Lachnospiraceae bacterium]
MKRRFISVLTLLFFIPVAMYSQTCNAKVNKTAEEELGKIYSEQEFYFEGDDAEQEEFLHFLLAKLIYDDLDEFEGKSVRDYIDANDALYDKEIWTDSGIKYNNLYNRFIGEFTIYKVYNNNSESGFYAAAFVDGSHGVLAFRGSEMFTDSFPFDESNDWTGTDFKFALLNKLSSQFDDSISAYSDFASLLNSEGKNRNITFTGHSLGGALVTNASIITGCYGYSFDGACGHVIDLVYYYNFLDIDMFSGVEDMPFCNYTDDTGYLVADMIQHTNADAMYQLDRKTNLDKMSENTAIPKYSTAASHIIWSTLGHEGERLFFLDKCVKEGQTYTYEPDKPITIDITKNIIGAGTENFTDFSLPGCFEIEEYQSMKEELIAASLGALKDGRVMLASKKGSVMRAYDKIGVNSSFAVSAVMYGGSGNDRLYGYTADDVLIAGDGTNILDGGLGKDTYIIDKYKNSTTYIYDGGEECYIILRNFGIDDISGITLKNNSIALGDGQTVKLDIKQNPKDIHIYCCDDGIIDYMGDMSQLGYKPDIQKPYNRIIMLKGKGRIELTNGSGNTLVSLENNIKTTKTVENKFCKAYICGEVGNESIVLFMNDSCEAVLSSDKKADAAFGRIDDVSSDIICGKVYSTKFVNYHIDFYNENIMNQKEGEIGTGDAIDSGINYLINLLLKGTL